MRYFLVGVCAVMSMLVAAQEQSLFIGGSTTVSRLVETTQEPFYAQSEIRIQVRSMGTTKGIKAVSGGIVDIGLASRFLTPAEQEANPNIEQIVIAQDAIAFIVNSKNPTKSLSQKQLSHVYSGKHEYWSELGTDYKERLVLLSKGTGHGTFDVMTDYLGLDYLYNPRDRELKFKPKSHSTLYGKLVAKTYDKHNQAVGLVMRTPGAIAYDSLSAIQSLLEKRPETAIRLLAIDGALPSIENLANGTYQFIRPLVLLVHTSKVDDMAIQKYISYLRSDEGQKYIKAKGYQPVI